VLKFEPVPKARAAFASPQKNSPEDFDVMYVAMKDLVQDDQQEGAGDDFSPMDIRANQHEEQKGEEPDTEQKLIAAAIALLKENPAGMNLR
jgi:hypothetical protein